MCDYNLRGLSEPRCPECGYRFEWDALLDPTKRLHPYLFEHHPERNVRSFVRTFLGGLLPRRFWRGLQPAQPSFPGRLAAYASVVLVALVVLAPAAVLLYTAATLMLRFGWLRTWGQAFDLIRSARFSVPVFHMIGYYLLWAAGTFLALLVFRISMRRARIRPVHVVRCVIYSFDAAVWAVILVVAAAVATAAGIYVLRLQAFHGLAFLVVAAPWAVAAVVFYRLVIAYRLYLRFDHPFLTVLASQLIAWLIVLNVAFW